MKTKRNSIEQNKLLFLALTNELVAFLVVYIDTIIFKNQFNKITEAQLKNSKIESPPSLKKSKQQNRKERTNRPKTTEIWSTELTAKFKNQEDNHNMHKFKNRANRHGRTDGRTFPKCITALL